MTKTLIYVQNLNYIYSTTLRPPRTTRSLGKWDNLLVCACSLQGLNLIVAVALWRRVVGFFLPYFCRVNEYTKRTELVAGDALI